MRPELILILRILCWCVICVTLPTFDWTTPAGILRTVGITAGIFGLNLLTMHSTAAKYKAIIRKEQDNDIL